MSHHAFSQDHHPTLRHYEREEVGALLQVILVVLTDLALTGKHAHWNVVGPNFRPLHLFLDEMIETWRTAADGVAERAAALGHSPDGRIATVAAHTDLPALPAGEQHDVELIAALTKILTEAIGTVRERTAQLEDVDVVTADLLHGVLADLEEQLWMIRVQAA
jgi:starvation-inducible DNA-binding protein